jgi:hypothetical protein
MTMPVPLRLTTEVPGGGDAWQHIWNLWWVKEALLNLHTNPYHTDLLYYPDGVNLYFHTLVLTAGLIGIPLQLLGLNLIATYNVVLLLTFVLAGYGAFLLCHYLTRNLWASFVGGIIFAFSPYHVAHMFGHMNLVSLQWIPFYVLLLLKTFEPAPEAETTRIDRPPDNLRLDLRDRRLLYAVAAGALLAVNAYTDWVYGIFMALFTGVYVAWKVLMPSERHALASTGTGWLQAGLRLLVIGLTFLVLTTPIFFPTLAEARKGYAQQPPEETLFYSADMVNAFLPSELHPMWGSDIRAYVQNLPPYLPLKNPSERVLFLGYTALVAAAFAAIKLWRDRRVRFWSVLAILMWLLSLGPVLQVLGNSHFTAFGVTVPLPYLLLYKLPLFSIMRTPARLTVLVTLALTVLVSFALAYLLRPRPSAEHAGNGNLSASRRSPVPAALFALVIPLLALFEYLPFPLPTVPAGWNVPIYRQIASEPGNFALLELPIRSFGDYMAYQTIHGKPIIGGYLSRQPPYPLLETNAAVKYMLDTTAPTDPVRISVQDGKGVQSLRDLGVKYVIIRWWAFTEEQRTAMQEKLNVLLARPPDFTYPADMVDVWQLSP